jgi:hypothetical protein
MKRPKFSLGEVVATAQVMATIPNAEVQISLRRHETGDWGRAEAEDRQANERALLDGTRLLSIYRSSKGVKFWIITEADRSTTTVLLPEEC